MVKSNSPLVFNASFIELDLVKHILGNKQVPLIKDFVITLKNSIPTDLILELDRSSVLGEVFKAYPTTFKVFLPVVDRKRLNLDTHDGIHRYMAVLLQSIDVLQETEYQHRFQCLKIWKLASFSLLDTATKLTEQE